MKGACHCGAISYELLAAPFDVDYCHCSDCRRAIGAPMGVWMDCTAGQVKWLQSEPQEYASSDRIRRGFCASCGTSLSYRHLDHPAYLSLSVSTLDDPEAVTPKYHIYTGQQLKWLDIRDDLPRHRSVRSND